MAFSDYNCDYDDNDNDSGLVFQSEHISENCYNSLSLSNEIACWNGNIHVYWRFSAFG